MANQEETVQTTTGDITYKAFCAGFKNATDSHQGGEFYMGKCCGEEHTSINSLTFSSPVPQGKIIVSAKLQLFLDTNTNYDFCENENLELKISAEDVDNSTVPTSLIDLEGRVLTTAKVDWDHNFELDDECSWVDSPDITTVIQEVVNRVGYAEDNNLTVFIKDDGSTPGSAIKIFSVFEEFLCEHTEAPKLYIEWEDLAPDTEINLTSSLTAESSMSASIMLFEGIIKCTPFIGKSGLQATVNYNKVIESRTWITDNLGAAPWKVGGQKNKTTYNEGSKIAIYSNPVWNIAPNTKTPITTIHNPCGYWSKVEDDVTVIHNAWTIISDAREDVRYGRIVGVEEISGVAYIVYLYGHGGTPYWGIYTWEGIGLPTEEIAYVQNNADGSLAAHALVNGVMYIPTRTNAAMVSWTLGSSSMTFTASLGQALYANWHNSLITYATIDSQTGMYQYRSTYGDWLSKGDVVTNGGVTIPQGTGEYISPTGLHVTSDDPAGITAYFGGLHYVKTGLVYTQEVRRREGAAGLYVELSDGSVAVDGIDLSTMYYKASESRIYCLGDNASLWKGGPSASTNLFEQVCLTINNPVTNSVVGGLYLFGDYLFIITAYGDLYYYKWGTASWQHVGSRTIGDDTITAVSRLFTYNSRLYAQVQLNNYGEGNDIWSIIKWGN